MWESLETHVYVASTWCEGEARHEVRAPWSGEVLAQVHLASAATAERAAWRAAALSAEFAAVPTHARRAALLAVAAGLLARREQFAQTIANEAAKPIRFARVEVDRAILTFTLAAEECTRHHGAVLALDVSPTAEQLHGYYTHVPRGPVLAITPFNFPLNLVAHKVAPALAVGAPVVLKPAPQTPLTALLLAEVVRNAGFPADALQVVPCSLAVAQLLVAHPAFAVVSFTGSEAVGYALRSAAPRAHCVLELGGNAAAIVHEDAAAGAAEKLVQSAFDYAGQVCIKTQRVFVHRPIAAAFVDAFVAGAQALAPQDPLSESTRMACVIDEASAVRIEGHVATAVARGARALVFGVRVGNRSPVSVLAFESDGAGLAVVDDEIFGPVATVHVYDTWSEALIAANRSRFGLQAAVFTDSQARIDAAYRGLAVGGLVVNDGPSLRVDHTPYGGVRASGSGREGVRFAMLEYTTTKMLVMRRA